jgi:hypothetical protein
MNQITKNQNKIEFIFVDFGVIKLRGYLTMGKALLRAPSTVEGKALH